MGRLNVASGSSGPGTTAWRLCGAACLPAARREAQRQHGARHGRPRPRSRSSSFFLSARSHVGAGGTSGSPDRCLAAGDELGRV
jgi:hypothetical protein